MRKVTKKSLDELAKIMPPMSVEEQKTFIGGDWYKVTGDGHFIKTLDTICDQDLVLGPSGTTYLIDKGILGNKISDSGNTSLYTGSIPLGFFEFLANSTNVEWGLSVSSNGSSMLSTAHDYSNTVYYVTDSTVAVYHNHDGIMEHVGGPSPTDIESKNMDSGNITHDIYVEGSGTYVSY